MFRLEITFPAAMLAMGVVSLACLWPLEAFSAGQKVSVPVLLNVDRQAILADLVLTRVDFAFSFKFSFSESVILRMQFEFAHVCLCCWSLFISLVVISY